jgi:hypothetical protein
MEAHFYDSSNYLPLFTLNGLTTNVILSNSLFLTR